MCGGFTCSKNALIALNILYILVAFILIGVAVYGRVSALGTNLPIIGGILACGIFLFLVSILGLMGAVKHHQVMLFFYMVILFLLFLVQFSVACACLAVNIEQQHQLAEQGWKTVSYSTKGEVQQLFGCCGFHGRNTTEVLTTPDPMAHPECNPEHQNEPCINKLQNTIDYAFKLSGSIGLFFSFTEVIAAFIAFRYRDQINPNDKSASAMLHKQLYIY